MWCSFAQCFLFFMEWIKKTSAGRLFVGFFLTLKPKANQVEKKIYILYKTTMLHAISLFLFFMKGSCDGGGNVGTIQRKLDKQKRWKGNGCFDLFFAHLLIHMSSIKKIDENWKYWGEIFFVPCLVRKKTISHGPSSFSRDKPNLFYKRTIKVNTIFLIFLKRN